MPSSSAYQTEKNGSQQWGLGSVETSFLTKVRKEFQKKFSEQRPTVCCLLDDYCDVNHKITGHSFRAAIPTLISSHPDKNTVSELKGWGNWESDSFKAYEKNDRVKRRTLFAVDSMYASYQRTLKQLTQHNRYPEKKSYTVSSTCKQCARTIM